MGVGHLSPNKTRYICKTIEHYEGYHVDEYSDDTFMIEDRQNRVVDHFTREYGFEEVDEWVGDNEKIMAETRHGVQLRALYHPSGTTIYYYLVITDDGTHESNLAWQHFMTYKDSLKDKLKQVYGDLYRKKTAYTSVKV